jgi:methyltransferase (TIGR00027 family)
VSSGPSVTAAVVASTLLLVKDDPELARLDAAPQPSCDSVEAAIRRALPLFGTLLDTVPWPVLERAAHIAERLVSPGFVTHYALRKHAIRGALRAAVERGHKQAVFVGAGFDMLSESLPSDARAFEVDHPATQTFRGKPERVELVPVDLITDSMASALAARPSFDPTASTVFVAEGLLMYLKRPVVDRVLAELARGPGERTIILSIVTPDPTAHGKVRLHSQRKVVDWIMRWIDEPFIWGEGPTELKETLGRHGFDIVSIENTMDLRDTLLSESARKKLPRSPGEIIVVAHKAARSESIESAALSERPAAE